MQTPLASIDQIDPAEFLAGDYDRNGSIEPADYDRWQAEFGELVMPWTGADGSGDGIIDTADYVVWRQAADGGAGASGDAAAAPEPAAIVLAAFASAAASCLRRRFA
jgi:hypothetical protein